MPQFEGTHLQILEPTGTPGLEALQLTVFDMIVLQMLVVFLLTPSRW